MTNRRNWRGLRACQPKRPQPNSLCQQGLPVYSVEETAGKAHSRVFTVSCSLDQLDLRATGSGSSRKKAEQQAASKLLDRLEA